LTLFSSSFGSVSRDIETTASPISSCNFLISFCCCVQVGHHTAKLSKRMGFPSKSDILNEFPVFISFNTVFRIIWMKTK